jgi:hypothetical protein
VQVRLDRTTDLNVQMPLGKFAEEVTVVAETPVVDPTQVSTGQNFTSDFMKFAAIGSGGRSYQSVIGNTAGAVDRGGNPSVYGSTIGENAFYIDGLDTTDPVTSTFGTNFNFDAIQEISFQTGGFEAEFGRATGGIVNLITKSGGNDYSGTLDWRYYSTSFLENGDHFDRDDSPQKRTNPALTLGGPIIRDRLWFFVSGEYIDSQFTPLNAPSTFGYNGQNYLAKLSWQATPSWRLVAKVSADPADLDNVDASQFVAADANSFQEQGGTIAQAEMSGILTASLLWNVQAGINRQELNAFPQSGDFDTPSHSNFDGFTYINASNAQYSERDRDELKTNLTWFVDELAGSHEFKGGLEYTSLFFSSHNYTTADGISFLDDGTPDSPVPVFMNVSTDPGVIENDGTLVTAYVQDAWKIRPNVTLKLGLRYDQVEYQTEAGATVGDMSMAQPRIGIAWDITNDSKNLVRASWGQFMHPNALTLPNFARTGLSTSSFYYSCSVVGEVSSPEECQDLAAFLGWDYRTDPVGFDPNGWFLDPDLVFGSAPNQIIDNLKPTYAEELILGYEREIFNRTSVEFSYVDKKTKDIFEDTCNGNYPVPSEDADCAYYLMANLPGLERKYEGYIARFETRAVDWLWLLTSYTYSKSEGNIEYTQNAGVDFDIYPTHFDNTYGYLSDDRRHRVKLNGYVFLPYEFTIGFDAFWSSAFAYDAQSISGYVSFADVFDEPRGSRRAEDNYQIDLQVSKQFKVGRLNVSLIGSINNLLSSERVTAVCTLTEGCADDRGNEYVLGQPTDWQNPRNYELGFRVEF